MRRKRATGTASKLAIGEAIAGPVAVGVSTWHFVSITAVRELADMWRALATLHQPQHPPSTTTPVNVADPVGKISTSNEHLAFLFGEFASPDCSKSTTSFPLRPNTS